MKLTANHRKLGAHYLRFVDAHKFATFTLTDDVLGTFIEVESHGRSRLKPDAIAAALPLLEAKANRELTIRMVIEECADWWSDGSGWFPPIASTVQHEWKRSPKDHVYLRALIKIMRACRDLGFIAVLDGFPGIPQSDKARYLNRYLQSSGLAMAL